MIKLKEETKTLKEVEINDFGDGGKGGWVRKGSV